MLNLLIVHDNQDSDIGSNCELCYDHISRSIELTEYETQVLNGIDCDAQCLQNTISGYNQKSFIFLAFSHGGDGKLVSCLHGEYVNVASSYFFAESLFYTNACCSAGLLSEALMYNGCKAFIGYSDDVKLPIDEIDDIKFIECENYAIIEFLKCDKELSICISEMKEYYNQRIDEFDLTGEVVLAARLTQNRDCLTIEGDTSITRQYFRK